MVEVSAGDMAQKAVEVRDRSNITQCIQHDLKVVYIYIYLCIYIHYAAIYIYIYQYIELMYCTDVSLHALEIDR